MKATAALRERAAILLAADATTLAPAADANVLALIMEPFAPGESLAVGSLVLATFDGATPLAVGVGGQLEGLDPLTNDAIISLKPPAGGFRFETTGVTNLPQTIYGYALLDDALAVLLGSDLLPAPVTLTAINQQITVPTPTLRLVNGALGQ